MTPQEKKVKILDDIRDLFGDTSVHKSETKDIMEEISEESQCLADAIDLDD